MASRHCPRGHFPSRRGHGDPPRRARPRARGSRVASSSPRVARVTAATASPTRRRRLRADASEVSSLKRARCSPRWRRRASPAPTPARPSAPSSTPSRARARGAVGDVPFADVSGRWSLVYSTNDDKGSAALGPLADLLDDSALQRVTDQLYKAFFAFAPALAGLGGDERARRGERPGGRPRRRKGGQRRRRRPPVAARMRGCGSEATCPRSTGRRAR